jgi:AraC family transcriptional regulator
VEGVVPFHAIRAFAIEETSKKLTFSAIPSIPSSMFLLYRNQGERRFGRQPIAPYPRRAWEFQVVIEGRCSLLIRDDNATRQERLTGPILAVTGPECVHGWGGNPSDVCKVIIFHFDEVDYAVRSIVGQPGYRLLRFSPEEVPAFQALYDRCGEARRAIGTTPPEAKRRAGLFEPLVYQIVATELALFFLKHISKNELGPAPTFGESKVAEALAWYEANLGRRPTLSDVALAVHISSTHLRRLFHRIRDLSPKNAFMRVQFERVKWLMRDPSMTLDQIGESAGFGSASAFSRAFKKEFGVSPRTYRETRLKKASLHT